MKLSLKMYNYSLDCLRSGEFRVNQKYLLRDHVKKKFDQEISDSFMPNTTVEYSVFDAILAYKASPKAINRNWKNTSYSSL